MEAKKSTKLYLMIMLSTFFFFLELLAGYATGSIALLADAFHMLSDVSSLIIALYATKVHCI